MHKHTNGYLIIYAPDHISADKKGRVYVHRYVMEKRLKRRLLFSEQVHHVDGNKQNNKLSNLQLIDNLSHRRHHHGWKLIDGAWWKTCSECGKFKEVNDSNFYRRKTGSKRIVPCCKECNAHYCWRLRHGVH